MLLKKIFRYLVLTMLGIAGFLIIFMIVSVAPVDRTPAQETATYDTMMARLHALNIAVPQPLAGFSVGFGKANITPSEPVSTAGYGKRRAAPYVEVHDSIYVRSVVVSNGSEKVAIVSADLLIMPPTVTNALRSKLTDIGFSLDNTYLGATHSHNSIGHWGEGATRFIYGAYEDSIVQFIADGIVRSIAQADHDLVPAEIKSGSIAVPHAVENRLIDGGPEDPLLRVVEFQRQDSSKALMVSYAAHATCLSTATLDLSRDYPGMLVDALEGKGYDFAMFLAGGVGSHRESAPLSDWACLSWMAQEISNTFLQHRDDDLQLVSDTSLVMERVPLMPGSPQVKIGAGLKLRPWLFRSAFGEYDAFLTVLRIGDLVMLGTPCDFSGEFNASIDSIADVLHMKAMVTSFNGGYIGYLTPAAYYDVDHYETQLMNWYAPGTGEYVRDCLGKLMIAVSDTR